MEFIDAEKVLIIVTLGFGFIAAGLWSYSSILRVTYKEQVDEEGFVSAAIISDGSDVIETITRQSIWKARAAATTALGVLCQTISIILF